ncbi:MAG: ABC transporter permease, partial [Mesorhizobium sp.]
MAVMTESAPRRRALDLNVSWTDIGPFLALAALLVVGYLINH